jgi:3-hydroxyisobutyrate dehydrogenase-like beta-hydroxyacid dehydrogenase
MVARILASGHDVVVHARRPEAHAELQGRGAKVTSAILEAATDVDILGVNLFDDEQLRRVMYDQGVLNRVSRGTVIVIHSTGDPALVEALASSAPPGVAVVDATFSGTAQDVTAARLTLICGCDARVLDRVRPVLDAYASKVFRVGPVGAARKLKLLNNLLFAAQISLANEALAAARAMGLGRADSVAAIGASSGSSYALHKLAGSASPLQVLAAMQPYLDKDVRLARTYLAGLGSETPLLDQAAPWGRYEEGEA